jgi:hypothetical protein
LSRCTIVLATAGLLARTGFAQAVDPNLWVVSGTVNAVARSANTLYVGGVFTQIGPPTGAGVPIDPVNGSPAASFAKIAGVVSAVAPDGSGGWFVGGGFTAANGTKNNLVHVLADNGLDSWNPNPNGAVSCIAVSGSLVYVGGDFTSVGGQARNHIAALDANTGLATTWDPNASGGGFPWRTVSSLAVSGTTVYVGGNFTGIGGQPRNRIAALDAATGLATSWNPNASGWTSFPGNNLNALAVSGTTVYAGGFFTTIGGQSRNCLAALDATTGLATSWNPNPLGTLSALTVSGGTLYAGGDFTSIGMIGRHYAAAWNTSTGFLTSWNPNANSPVSCFSVNGATVYAGGGFSTIGGQTRNGLAALDASTGVASSWNPNTNGLVAAVAAGASAVYAGGSFTSMGGQPRSNLAALDVTTGLPTAWNPGANGQVSALVLEGATLYVSGSFTSVGGVTRNNLAAVDESGNVTAWDPNANASVNALNSSGGTLYAGGSFTAVAGQPRNRGAAWDMSTGVLTGWDPNANNAIQALAAAGSAVYAGGDFTTIGGQARSRIAALDPGTGAAVLGWDANASTSVRALAATASTVYAGGDFVTIGGQSRNRIAALDAGTGAAVLGWDPNASSTVRALAISGTTLYAGGNFTSIGGQNRNRIAALDVSTGLAAAWNPDASDGVNALAIRGATLHAGGAFLRVGSASRGKIAAIAASPGIEAITPATGGGHLTVSVSGSGLPAGAAVKLARSGEPEIVGTEVSVAGDAASLSATFDLTGAAEGSWDVVVTTPDQQTATLPAGFTLSVTGVGDESLAFRLEAVRPNPSALPVSLTYSLPTAARVELTIYDLAGREVITLVHGERPAGRHTVTWDSSDAPAPAGLYFVRFDTPVGSLVRRVALIR